MYITRFKRYASDGTEIPIQPVGIVSESKQGNEITRSITDEEKRALDYGSK